MTKVTYPSIELTEAQANGFPTARTGDDTAIIFDTIDEHTEWLDEREKGQPDAEEKII